MREGRFDPKAAARLARPRRLAPVLCLLIALAQPFGLIDFYYKMHLKKHGGWPKRFDQPYAAYVKSNI